MAGLKIVYPKPGFETGDNFCLYIDGHDHSRFWADADMPGPRDVVDAITSRTRGKRRLVSKEDSTFTANGFNTNIRGEAATHMDKIKKSGREGQVMLFQKGDEPYGIEGDAGIFFITAANRPAAVGSANALAMEGTGAQAKDLIVCLQPLREFVDADFPVSGDIVEEPAGNLDSNAQSIFGGAGYLQITEFDTTGVADVEVEIRHSNDSFAADDNLLKSFGVKTTAHDTDYFLLPDDIVIEKDLRIKLVKTGVGTVDKFQCVVGFFRALELVKG